jgi:PGF-pre-PGF domain-containing protein
VAVKNNVSNVTINVKESSKPSAAPNVTKPDEGVVLKYLEISQTNLADANISSVFINFQVEKSWVTANNIDVGTIALYRYVNSTWVKLQTKKINETSTYLYFQSISPGLSIFAIAGQKAKGLPWLLIFVIGGAIAVAVLAYLFWPVEEKKLSPVAHAPEKIEKKDEIKETWDVLKKKWDELTEKKEKT